MNEDGYMMWCREREGGEGHVVWCRERECGEGHVKIERVYAWALEDGGKVGMEKVERKWV